MRDKKGKFIKSYSSGYGFKKGHIPWNKGKHCIHSGSFKKGHKPSKKTREKMSISHSKPMKGGKRRDNKGYIYIYKPDHPFCNKNKYISEAHLVMESIIGRYLRPEEIVHHKGTKYPMGSFEDKGDNRKENLKLFKNESEHQRFHCLNRTH